MELKSHFLIPARLEGQAGWAGLSDLSGGWSGREVQKGGDVCIHIADLLCCTAETNILL